MEQLITTINETSVRFRASRAGTIAPPGSFYESSMW